MEPFIYRQRRPPAASLASANRKRVIDIDDVHTLAQGMVDTIRDPLLVLDQHLRVVTANRAFCQTFRMTRQNIEDRAVYALADGQWDIPALRFLLEKIAPQHTVMEGYEVEREFPGIGRRSMLLNAREVVSQRNARKLILLTIEDVTERRAAEREAAEFLRQKEMLLQEMEHRIANSLQIIASILLLKARTVQSEETRMHLRDAHQRVMSVAAVQQQLLAPSHGDPVYIGPYLSRLSQALAASMTDDSRPISLEVQAEGGGTASSAEAASMGLIVTELVINAFKHAFVGNEAAVLVVVAYEAAETSWRLTVSDNGIETPEGQLDSNKPRPGLGTIIVAGLAKKLDARVEVMRGRGTTVSITHGTSDRAWLPQAGAGIGSPSKSNGNRVSKRRWCMRASEEIRPSKETSHGNDPNYRSVTAAVWRRRRILGSYSRLLVSLQIPASGGPISRTRVDK
jgi:PAS domain S-box-containing protein